ncbi:hypothetical protein AAMO2058_000520800 [Amorphochlora amoebiformis]
MATRRRYSYSVEHAHVKKQQDDMKKHTFTMWVNAKLKIGGFQPVKELFSGLSDGIKLMQLMNVLTGQSIPKHTKICQVRPQRLDNVSLALGMVRKAGIDLRFVHNNFIVDMNGKMILALIWAIIRKRSLELVDYAEEEETGAEDEKNETNGESKSSGKSKENSRTSSPARNHYRGEKGLLEWVRHSIRNIKPKISLNNFSSDWNDGRALCYLVHRYKKAALDLSLITTDAKKNCELGLAAAERVFKVPRLVGVEELSQDVPDEASVLTYVATFYEVIKTNGRSLIDSKSSLQSANSDLRIDEEGETVVVLPPREDRRERGTRQARGSSRLAEELEKIRKERDDCCDKEADCQKEVRALKAEIEDLKKKYQDALKRIAELQTKTELLSDRESKSVEQVKVLKDELRMKASEMIAIRKLMAEKENTVQESLNRLAEEKQKAVRASQATREHGKIYQDEIKAMRVKHLEEIEKMKKELLERESANAVKEKIQKLLEEIRALREAKESLIQISERQSESSMDVHKTLTQWQVVIEGPPDDMNPQPSELEWLRDVVKQLRGEIKSQSEEMKSFYEDVQKKRDAIEKERVSKASKTKAKMEKISMENTKLRSMLSSYIRRAQEAEDECKKLRETHQKAIEVHRTVLASVNAQTEETKKKTQKKKGLKIKLRSMRKDTRSGSTPIMQKSTPNLLAKTKRGGLRTASSRTKRGSLLNRSTSALPSLEIPCEPKEHYTKRSKTMDSPSSSSKRKSMLRGVLATAAAMGRWKQFASNKETNKKKRSREAKAIDQMMTEFAKDEKNSKYAAILSRINDKCEARFGKRKIRLANVKGSLMVRCGGGFQTLGSFCLQNFDRESRNLESTPADRRASMPASRRRSSNVPRTPESPEAESTSMPNLFKVALAKIPPARPTTAHKSSPRPAPLSPVSRPATGYVRGSRPTRKAKIRDIGRESKNSSSSFGPMSPRSPRRPGEDI